MTNFSDKTLESFYFDPRTGVYYAVFEDGYIRHDMLDTKHLPIAVDDAMTFSIYGRIQGGVHRNSDGYDVNYYHDDAEGVNGQDYHCEVRVLEHSLRPKAFPWSVNREEEYFQKRDGAKYFAKWAKGYSWKWSV